MNELPVSLYYVFIFFLCCRPRCTVCPRLYPTDLWWGS